MCRPAQGVEDRAGEHGAARHGQQVESDDRRAAFEQQQGLQRQRYQQSNTAQRSEDDAHQSMEQKVNGGRADRHVDGRGHKERRRKQPDPRHVGRGQPAQRRAHHGRPADQAARHQTHRKYAVCDMHDSIKGCEL